MKLKNNIKFDSWSQSQKCARVINRLPSRYNLDIMTNLATLQNKIWLKDENDDGTVRIRLAKEWTEYYGTYVEDSIHTVRKMYKKEYADAFMKLFSCSEED